MCKSSLHSFLHALPKCEHHVHIEGSLMPSLLFTLASRNAITLPPSDPAYASESSLLDRYNHFTSLDDFLAYYYTAMSVLRNPSDFHDLAWAYFQQASRDGVVHAEISFDPQAHTSRGVPFDVVVEGFRKAQVRAQEELGLSSQLICCFLRHLPVPAALELFDAPEVQAAFGAGTITGIGLDSSENGFPPELFDELYRKAQAAGLRLTAHAGEEGPARNIQAALTTLGCERIDHGIRLADDPALMAEVAARGTLLTVCPLSNVRLRCVESVAQLPIRKFLDAGLKFSLNSDDPAYFGGFVLDNYCAVQDAFELNKAEWQGICMAAIEGSWCEAERKTEMVRMLEDVQSKFN